MAELAEDIVSRPPLSPSQAGPLSDASLPLAS